jgi:predicted dehydrogenase
VLDNLFAPVKSGVVPRRDARQGARRRVGKPYVCTADDSAYATFELERGIIAHFNSSWTVRVKRDDLLTVQVDGTKGSAVAGPTQLHDATYGATPRPVWNPDQDSPINSRPTG